MKGVKRGEQGMVGGWRWGGGLGLGQASSREGVKRGEQGVVWGDGGGGGSRTGANQFT